MSDRVIENVIEWIDGQKTATVTLSSRRQITKVKKLAEKHPDLVQIDWENKDGSIVAHMPVSAIIFRIDTITEEERERRREIGRKNIEAVRKPRE